MSLRRRVCVRASISGCLFVAPFVVSVPSRADVTGAKLGNGLQAVNMQQGGEGRRRGGGGGVLCRKEILRVRCRLTELTSRLTGGHRPSVLPGDCVGVRGGFGFHREEDRCACVREIERGGGESALRDYSSVVERLRFPSLRAFDTII